MFQGVGVAVGNGGPKSGRGGEGEKWVRQGVATCIRELNDGGNRWKSAGRSLSP